MIATNTLESEGKHLSESKVDRNAPKSLTTKQRRLVDHLIKKLGPENHTKAKRADLKTESASFLGTSAAPAWITRNPHCRLKGDGNRGLYNLAVLAKLPVVDPEEKPAPVKKEKAPKKAAVKKTAAPKKEPAAKKEAAKPAPKKAAAKKKTAAPKKDKIPGEAPPDPEILEDADKLAGDDDLELDPADEGDENEDPIE